MGTHTGLFGWVCVSCAYILTLPAWVVGVGAFGLGIETKQACCRVHVQHLLGDKPTTGDARWFVWCLRLCGVLFVICIVVDEHLYCNVKPIL